ncbi:MAG: hypothetical protein AAF581_05590 [Planctomycetota bacterium]
MQYHASREVRHAPILLVVLALACVVTSGCRTPHKNPGQLTAPTDGHLSPPNTGINELDAQPLLEDLQPNARQARGPNGRRTGADDNARAQRNVKPQKLIEVEHLSGDPTPAAANTNEGRPNAPIIDVTRSGNQEEAEPEITTMSMLEHALRTQRKKLLRELANYSGVDERTLDDAARLTKQNLEIRLIALHFLEGNTDVGDLAPLLDAMGSPHYPGEVHSLLRAALYHDVGSEDLRDRALGGLRSTATTSPFDLVSVELCRSIGNRGRRDRFQKYLFKPDQALHVYGELLHLHATETTDGWLSKVRIEVFLVRDKRVIDHRRLGDFNDTQPQKRDTNFFGKIYRLPLLINNGDYELRVVATDLNVEPNAIVQQRLQIRIEK